MLNILFVGNRIGQAKENSDFLMTHFKCQVKSCTSIKANVQEVVSEIHKKKYDLLFIDPINGGNGNDEYGCFDIVNQIKEDPKASTIHVIFYTDVARKANIQFTGVYNKFQGYIWEDRFKKNGSLENILQSYVNTKYKSSPLKSKLKHYFDLKCPAKRNRTRVIAGAILLAFLSPVAVHIVQESLKHKYYDEREIANQYYLELADFDLRSNAKSLQDSIIQLSKISSDIVKTEQGQWTYPIGLLFTPEDVLVARSFEEKGGWIVAIDLVESNKDKENRFKAEEKANDIISRIEILDNLNQRLDSGSMKTYVTYIRVLKKYFSKERIKQYDVTEYDLLYDSNLKDKLLD